MPIPYPPQCDTDEKKLQWCLAMHVKLRTRHNNIGLLYETWLGNQPRNQQWLDWLATWWDPRHRRLTDEVLRLRQLLRQKPIDESPDDL